MKKRETELDILRIIALLGVIFTHASGIGTCSGVTGNVMTFLIATVTWHVPVFVMISGRFFLDPERKTDSGKLVKAIWRLIVAFAFWNVIYQIYYVLAGSYSGLNWKGILSQAMIGPYHFWYLIMLMGLYAVVPFLRKITEDQKLAEYFIVLFLIFGFLTMYGPELPLVGTTVSAVMHSANIHFVLGFSGYYILGYYLWRYPLTGRNEMGLYALGLVVLGLTGLATVWKTAHGAEGGEWFSKYLMPNVVIEAAAIYTFFVNRIGRLRISEKTAAIVSKVSEYSFGIYLIHALVLELLEKFGLGLIPVHPMLAVILNLGLCFLISAAAVALLRKIPCIGKKIT